MPRGGYFEVIENIEREPLFKGGQGRTRKDVRDSGYGLGWVLLLAFFVLASACLKGCAAEIDLEAELFAAAEEFVDADCKARGLDPKTEKALWLKSWAAKCETAIASGTADSEAAYLQRVTIAKRGNLSASADYHQVLEACRILLRWRDAKIELLASIRSALTAERVESIRTLLREKSK